MREASAVSSAYTDRKHREGIYVQLNHSGDGQQVAALERHAGCTEDVIAILTVQAGRPPARPPRARRRSGPSAEPDASTTTSPFLVQKARHPPTGCLAFGFENGSSDAAALER